MNAKLGSFGVLLMAASMAVNAGGAIDFLEVQEEVVLFSTAEAKTTTSPDCVLTDNATQWSISLDSQSGRATYSMLVTAMAMGMEVNVGSANDCAVLDGVEQAQRVWFETQE